MGDNFIQYVFYIQWALIAVLIYVIFELKRHIIQLESKIYGQQMAIMKLQDNINKVNEFLYLNTSKWSKDNTL